MAVKDLDQKLKGVIQNAPSNWEEKSKQRVKNRSWLKRSAKIALRIKSTLKAKGLSQVALAEMMGVTPQNISKILKGKENLTLETIDKLEKALSIELIKVPSFSKTERLAVPGSVSQKTPGQYTKVVKGERQRVAFEVYSSASESTFTVEKDAA